MLTDDDVTRIKQEEKIRLETQKALNPPREKSWWDYLNSQFALWFLSSVVLGLITLVWNQLNDERLKKQRGEQEAQATQRDDSQFLANLLPYLTNSDATVRLRATAVILARYPEAKVPEQIQVFIVNAIANETKLADAKQSEDSQKLLAYVTSTLARVQNSDATRALESLKSDVKNTNQQQQVTIVYYPKLADLELFEKHPPDDPAKAQGLQAYLDEKLKDAGFNLRSLAGRTGNQGFATNAVWIGDAVSVNQAKFAALVLMQAGMQIRALRRFRSDFNKQQVVEIGSDAAIQQGPPLTVQQVIGLTDIPKR